MNPISQPQSGQQSIYGRNGVNLNRGIDFLRNTIFGHNAASSNGDNGSGDGVGIGIGNTCNPKDYKLLNHSINSQPDQYKQRIK